MKKILPSQSVPNMVALLVVSLFLISFSTLAQVGIGTTTPDASSVLDVSSNTQGLLAPRMSTTDRTNISSPAEGLLVFDTDEDAFFYYDTTSGSWIEMIASKETRDNFVLVKSEADFPTPSGGVITLDPNTYYEINGLVTLSNPINLNDAYLAGLDANEDILFSAGTVFSGNMGGSIRNITIAGGGTAFNITGGSSLLLQNTIVSGMANVGTISNVGLYFSNIVQYVGNTNGITYINIGSLLLSNQGWFGNNAGTFETFTGSFDLIQKVSGFSTVNGSAVGIDVSNNPAVTDGVIIGTAFSGTSTTFIDKYTTNTYPGYSFTNKWTVDCPGISKESDDDATGNVYYTAASVYTISNNNAAKVQVTTTPTRMLRTSTDNGSGAMSNRLVYEGSKTRNFIVNAALSYTATGGSQFRFSIFKNGVEVPGTSVLINTLVTNQNQSVAILGTVDLKPNDYIEVYVQKTSSGNESFLIQSFSMLLM